MSILDRDALAASPLADLHALASELSIDGYRRLRKDDLIDAIIARQGGLSADGADEEDREADEDRPATRRRRGRRGGRSRTAAREEEEEERGEKVVEE